jgi:hypothetical protein
MTDSIPLASTIFHHNEGDNVRVPKLTRLLDHVVGLESAPEALVELVLFVDGSPGAGARLIRFASKRDMIAVAADSMFDAEEPATAASVFTLRRDGVVVGTITFGAGQSKAVVAFTDPDFPAESVLELFAPTPQDATLANVSISIGAIRESVP